MNTEFTLTQKRALAIFTLIALLFGAYFLRNYFVLIVVAAVGAYLFTPLFNRFNRRLGTGLVGHLHPVVGTGHRLRAGRAPGGPGGRSDFAHGRQHRRMGQDNRSERARRQGPARSQ